MDAMTWSLLCLSMGLFLLNNSKHYIFLTIIEQNLYMMVYVTDSAIELLMHALSMLVFVLVPALNDDCLAQHKFALAR